VFSRRIPSELHPNRIATARAEHPPCFDLTISNPTTCGLWYPDDLLTPLAEAAGLVYRPHPKGLEAARAAVAAEYLRWGASVDPDAVVLTASTSEAYAFLFKLLCEPGDAVLVPSPSYPLFEHLARLEAVEPIAYHLVPEAGWRVDLAELGGASDRVRAAVVVHPNNPTGSFLDPADAAEIAELCATRGWALIADEVFLDFALDGGPGNGRTLAGAPSCLTFCLGGLSKSCGLPQLKVSWIVVSGPAELQGAALERLELIADTYLSVATPVQRALPELLARGRELRGAISSRCRNNLRALRELVPRLPEVSVLPVGGGWSAVLRFPAVLEEETLAVDLLRHHGVAVYPGFFFDFPYEGVVVVSLLPEEHFFREGIRRLLDTVASRL
jgi:alanine-synthesizing transaminase